MKNKIPLYRMMILLCTYLLMTNAYSQNKGNLNDKKEDFVKKLCSLSEAYYMDGQIDLAVDIMESNLKFIEGTDINSLAVYSGQYAKVFYHKYSIQGKSMEQPIEKIKNALSLAEKSGNGTQLADIEDLKGLALYSQAFSNNDFNAPVPYLQKALAYRKEKGDNRGIAETIFHLAIIKDFKSNSTKQDKDEAMKLYREGYLIAKKGDFKVELSYFARHIAAQLISKDLDSAYFYFNQSLNLRLECGLKLFIAPAQNALADVFREMNKLSEAADLYNAALENATKTKAYRFAVTSLSSLGELELKNKNEKRAFEYFNRALALSTETGYKNGIEMMEERLKTKAK